MIISEVLSLIVVPTEVIVVLLLCQREDAAFA